MIDYGYGVKLDTISSDLCDLLREWRNNPEIRDWCRQVGLISERDQWKWLEAQNDDPSMRMFLIMAEEDGLTAAIGVCGLTSIDHLHRRAEFSCYISPGTHGKGYGTKALKTLFSFGFNELNLNLIWGETFDGNPAMRLFVALGMKPEGTRRQFYFKNGKYLDAHLISILREEWELKK